MAMTPWQGSGVEGTQDSIFLVEIFDEMEESANEVYLF
jgi:hypothetical protein